MLKFDYSFIATMNCTTTCGSEKHIYDPAQTSSWSKSMDINNTIPSIITGGYYKDLLCPLNTHAFKQCMTAEHTDKELAPFFALNHTTLKWENGVDLQLSLPRYLDVLVARGYASRKTISIWEPAKFDGFIIYFGESVNKEKRL